MTNDDLHELARSAACAALGEGVLDGDKYDALIAWLARAADAMRSFRDAADEPGAIRLPRTLVEVTPGHWVGVPDSRSDGA